MNQLEEHALSLLVGQQRRSFLTGDACCRMILPKESTSLCYSRAKIFHKSQPTPNANAQFELQANTSPAGDGPSKEAPPAQ